MSDKLNKNKAALDNLKTNLEDGNTIDDLKPEKISIGNLSNIITPLISNIFRLDSSINGSIDRLIQSTRDQLTKKGRVEVNNGKISFTPIKNQSYEVFKQRFINDVDKIKRRVKILDTKVKLLEVLFRTLNLTIFTLEARSLVKQIRTTVVSRAAQAESSSPSPAKPTTGQIIGEKIPDHEERLSKLEGKPVLPTFNKTDAIIIILRALRDALRGYLPIIKQSVNELNIKLDGLQLLIGEAPDEETRKLADELSNDEATEIVERYNNYILKIEKLANGSYQVVATDAFSGMKIAQTAPSKFLRPDALFEEIKQILG